MSTVADVAEFPRASSFEPHTFDVLIVGGGMVGAALACALGAAGGLRIALVEAQSLGGTDHPGYDERTLALAHGTRRIFEALGVWDALAPAATPIRGIHVSDRGRCGLARLEARDEGVEALGYVVGARAIGAALAARIAVLPAVELLCPAELESVSVGEDAACGVLRLGDGSHHAFGAKLVVAADGARSRVREQLGIPARVWNYGQSAVIANLTPARAHANVAYERFTEDGPMALLPLDQNRCALVLTVDARRADAILALDDQAFLALVQARFGERLGRLERVGARQAYPLKLVTARDYARARVAVVGNAMHTLHPIAGQGFNLGLRDAATLAEVLADAARAGRDIGGARVLAAYADWRRHDLIATAGFTDALVRVFGNPLPPVRLARNLGLLAFDLCAPAKRLLARHAMGLAGRLPRLARGLPV